MPDPPRRRLTNSTAAAMIAAQVVLAAIPEALFSQPRSGPIAWWMIALALGSYYGHATASGVWLAMGPGRWWLRLLVFVAWLAVLGIFSTASPVVFSMWFQACTLALLLFVMRFGWGVALIRPGAPTAEKPLRKLVWRWLFPPLIAVTGYTAGVQLFSISLESWPLLQGSLLAGVFVVLGLRGDLGWETATTTDVSAAVPRLRFRIRELLLLTTFIAVLLAISRIAAPWVMSRLGTRDTPYFLTLVSCNIVLVTPLALAVMLRRRFGWGIASGIALAAVAAVIEMSLVRLSGPGVRRARLDELLCLMNVVQASWVLALMGTLRAAGYRWGVVAVGTATRPGANK